VFKNCVEVDVGLALAAVHEQQYPLLYYCRIGNLSNVFQLSKSNSNVIPVHVMEGVGRSGGVADSCDFVQF
jgi:protein tyrosine phosphatase (PTP) superfamily phosphohydrolase (DUF442 family)